MVNKRNIIFVLIPLLASTATVETYSGEPDRPGTNLSDSQKHEELIFSARIPEEGALPDKLILKGTGRPQPDKYTAIAVNPPTFSWPRAKGKNKYEFELSQTPDFNNPRKISTTEQFYRPLAPLERGQWWWRYRAVGRNWKETSTFHISPDIHEWRIPDWNTLIARIPDGRPRIYMRPEEFSAYRKKASGILKPVVRKWAKLIEKEVIGKQLPVENGRLSISNDESASDPSIRKRRVRWAIKSGTNRLMSRVPDLCWLWMLTGKDQFAREARDRVMLATQLDPTGPTSFRSMNFANSTILRGAAIAYDMLYDTFSETERMAIRQMLLVRTRPVIEHFLQVPNRIFSPHGWQRLYLEAMIAALALHGDEEAAEPWLEAGLKRFVSFYPWFGGRDGGSAEGINYFTSTGLISSLRTADLFKAAFEIDFTQGNQWFQNNPFFLVYAYPPNSIMSRFGDTLISRTLKPPSSREHFSALRMASLYDNHFAADYANRIKNRDMKRWYFDLVRWMPFHEITPTSIDELPRARAFNDIGVVYMHSDITNPDSNVRFEFRSSPYGGYGHAHADQNSFNIIAGNRPLIIDSGFYDAFGSSHHDNWTTQTKAHNTILVDNIGQSREKRHLTNAYGRLRFFQEGDDWVYVLGSAETAYRDTALKRFDRHIFWLKGDDVQTYVIVDDLAIGDNKQHKLDWLLHSNQQMQIDTSSNQIIIENNKSKATVHFFWPEDPVFKQKSGFDVVPKTYRKSAMKHISSKQWHLTASSNIADSAALYTVIQVYGSKNVEPLPVSRFGDDIHIDKWTIRLVNKRISLSTVEPER